MAVSNLQGDLEERLRVLAGLVPEERWEVLACGHSGAAVEATVSRLTDKGALELICEECYLTVREEDAARRAAARPLVRGECLLCGRENSEGHFNVDLAFHVCSQCSAASLALQRESDKAEKPKASVKPNHLLSGPSLSPPSPPALSSSSGEEGAGGGPLLASHIAVKRDPLYIGPKEAAADLATLQELGIGQVLVCCTHLALYHRPSFSLLSSGTAAPFGGGGGGGGEEGGSSLPPPSLRGGVVRYHRLPIEDSLSQDILPYLDHALAFIARGALASQATLVHCNAGVSRSGSVAVEWLRQLHQLPTYEEALALAKSSRSNITPNSHFAEDLKTRTLISP